jgi:DNA-binding CsgD family transcriptional regulator/tetratricopeptide (TPR) repeat protein
MRDLVGRDAECGEVDKLLATVRDGQSQVLVVRGEPGVGKTALLQHAIAAATGFHVVRATGIESEMELAFAGLHQLCGPMLDRLAVLPDPQREAMFTAFGLTKGSAPDQFMIGLALLSLLSEAAEQAPLLCVVDDAQWLDRASAHALAFAARRLLAEPVCLLFGTREPTEDLRGLPEVRIGGLGHRDASALLATVVRGPIDDRVRDRVIAETHGNPLALLEWPVGLTPAELAGGFGLPALPVTGQIEEGFRRRVEELPQGAQQFLTVAAADPTGDPALVSRAANRIGVSGTDFTPAVESGLIEIGARVLFRHPLVRSASYAAAALDDRRAAHRALAEVTDPAEDPDRRAWHLALATAGPDDEVAAELERSAGRAQARGGLAAAAALLERSASLTLDPATRVQRTILAASAQVEAGGLDAAAVLLAAAKAGPLNELDRARIELLRGYSSHAWGNSSDAANLLFHAAKRLEDIDARLARETYIGALGSAAYATTELRGATQMEIAMAAREAPAAPSPDRPVDLLLEGYALIVTDGPAAAAPVLRQAVAAFRHAPVSDEEAMRWFGYPVGAATLLWDYDDLHWLSARQVDAVRALGAFRTLPWALETLAMASILGGDLSSAASLLREAESVIEATANRLVLFGGAQLAGCRGHDADAKALITATIERGRARGQGMAVKFAQSASATLDNGLGRYAQALAAAEEALRPPLHRGSHLTLHELVEAAVRSGQEAIATQAVEQLSETTQASGTDWALGIEARCRALLRTDEGAEALFREAIERLNRSPVRPEAARAHLLYGEWLRREGRRVDARQHLRDAYEQLSAMGMDAFAERARRELAATGETVRKRSVETRTDLTPQELQIARLVAEGHTNPEIGAQLFISARTVEYHLRKVFTKLAVTSRKELRVKLHESRQLSVI